MAAVILTLVPLLSLLAGYVLALRGGRFDPRWFARS